MNFLDFCAGIGGFRLGLELAGHKCIGFCEYDKYDVRSYRAMFDTKGEWFADDVTKLKSDEIPYAEIWCFGFPCQDISVAGKQKGLRGERSGIYFSIIDLVKGKKEEDKPTFLLIENVKNLLSINSGFDFATVLSELDEAGYRGMMQCGKCLTLKTLESPKIESECLLSHILEAEVDEKYYLSKEKTEQLLSKL